jgi:heterotetrameric sarcosine oxidase gamma subunit
MTTTDEKFSCRIDRLPCASALEFAAFKWPSPELDEPAWPNAPGAVRFDALQRPMLLHFAPGRWFAPEPGLEIRTLLAMAAQAAAGVVVDVTGKRDALLIGGPGAARLLSCAIAIEAILNARDCAALTLFDCPAIVARAPEGFAVWVQSSYTTDFVTTAERFRTSLESPP